MDDSKTTADKPVFKWRSTVSLSTLQEAASNINLKLIPRIRPSSFQWCPVTGQGAMGTDRSTGSSV